MAHAWHAVRKRNRRSAVLAAADLAIVVAFAKEAVGLVAAFSLLNFLGLLLETLLKQTRPRWMRLTSLLAEKPSRAEYERKAMEACAIGGG